MAASFATTFQFAAIFVCLFLVPTTSSKSLSERYNSIISFGDSITDTGNRINLLSLKPHHCALPPNGETFFHHPTGRCSDGRLIIDFLAEDLGLPLVAPFHANGNGTRINFARGVNFAVVGATALEDSFFMRRGIKIQMASVSLVAQFSWFKEMFNDLCRSTKDCKRTLQNSIVLLGEIGGNDINYALLQGRSKEEAESFIPEIVESIGSTANELIELGATTLMVPGNFPIGCSTAYLAYFRNSSKEKYDPGTGCIKWLNSFAEHYNEVLQMELSSIQKLHQHATIIYADYYNALMPLYQSPNKHGFTGGALKACCGARGPYNMNLSALCGYPPSSACDDPSKFVSWDGIHFTEAAYQWVAKGLLDGSYTTSPLGRTCT